MEQLLCRVESETAEIQKLLIGPFKPHESVTTAEKYVLCQFLTFQMVGGPRKRREIELQADYVLKIEAGHGLTERDQREITAVPHPNEHIKMIGPLSYSIFQHLLPRPVPIGRIDAPLFVTCDEPVLVDVKNHVRHGPDCNITQAELRRRRKRAFATRSTYRQIVHVWETRLASVQIADAIVMPLAPTVLPVLGRAGMKWSASRWTLP